MKKRIFNILVIIVFTLIMICNEFNISIASTSDLISSAQGESGSKPPPPTPPDSGGGSSGGGYTKTRQGDKTVNILCHNGISGNAYENLGTKIGEDGKDSSGIEKKNIQYIKVELFKSSDDVNTANPIKIVYTDNNGYYSFSSLMPGEYKMRFTYGLVENINSKTISDVNEIKEKIKYNGQDYMTEKVGGTGGLTYVAQTYAINEIITTSGKGCAQVFLAIDCSYSMRTSKIQVNGQEKTMLQAEIEAAKEMINSLLDGKKNIYIGIVAFSGTAYRAISLTDNVSILTQALDNINNGNWYNANTDVNAAIQKAYDSFANNDENSNRYILLLSDGIPTKYGSEEVYNDESESDTLEKLKSIANKTKDSLSKKINEDGVKIYGLFISSNNDTENDFIKYIFKDSCSVFYLENDIKAIINGISGDFKDYVISTIQVNDSGEVIVEDRYSIVGKEDSERRQNVNEHYSEFYYKNTSDFEAVDMSINELNFGTFKEKATNISEFAHMTVTTGTYIMEAMGEDYDVIESDTYQETAGGPMISYNYTVHYHYVQAIYENQDLVLNNRGNFTLIPKITANGLRVTASNSQVLKTIEKTKDDTIPLVAYLEPELIHGSRVDIEYTVTVKNDSSIPCNSLALIVNLPKGFSYNSKVGFVTGKINGNYQINPGSTVLYNNLLNSKYLSSEFNKGDFLILKTTSEFYLGPGQETKMNFMISKLISTEVDDSTYDASIEILCYKNVSARRMQYKKAYEYIGEYPGNNNLEEIDYASATNLAKVIPPTGSENNIIYIFIGIVSMAVLFVGIKEIKGFLRK